MRTDGRFQDIAIVGSGSLTVRVAKYLHDLGRRITLVEIPEVTRFSLRRRAEDIGISVQTVPKKDIPDYLGQHALKASREADTLLASARKPLLVLSVENMYLFPTPVVENPLIEILNYHNSLLPRHRGANAEAWAIFDEDHTVGFTWHLVDVHVDTGNIIYQESFDATAHDTSLGLLNKCSKRAFEAFTGFFAEFERGAIEPISQFGRNVAVHDTHRSRDRPNGGYLDANWCLAHISAFLRSYDYGKLNAMGQPLLVLDGATYTWRSYHIHTDIPAPAPCCQEGRVKPVPCKHRCTCTLDLAQKRITFVEKGFGTITLTDVRTHVCVPV